MTWVRGILFYNFLLLTIIQGWVRGNPLRRWQAQQAIKTAIESLQSLSVKGGFCGIYSGNIKKYRSDTGMKKMKPGHILVQPPGTPSAGSAFLRAYRLIKDKQILDAAVKAGMSLAWAQRTSGGWDCVCSVSHAAGGKQPARKKGKSTFDKGTTQKTLRFLIDLDKETDRKWLSKAIELGVDFVIRAQYPNGAWPQQYPLTGGYSDLFTFKNGVTNECIELMVHAHRIGKNKKYLNTALKGGDFILKSVVSGKQPGWAQQYSKDMKPARGRTFEPPALCSRATARNIDTLTTLYIETGDSRFTEPVKQAVTWLNTLQLSSGRWALLYEIGSNKPVYGSKDRRIFHSLEKVSDALRSSHTWEGPMGVEKAISRYTKVINTGREPFLKQGTAPLTDTERKARTAQLGPLVMNIAGSLDPEGFWKQGNEIHISETVKNLNILCEYLELTGDKQ